MGRPVGEPATAHDVGVVAGKDGWLFLDRAGEVSMLGLYTDEQALDAATLEAWAVALRRRREYFDALGVAYRTLVVPEAPLVYRDKLPDSVRVADHSPFERLRDTLDAGVRDQCVYPLDELVSGRARHETYAPRDVDWTDWGAWLGYRVTMTSLARSLPGIRVLEEADLDWSQRPDTGVLGMPGSEGGTLPTATVRTSRARLRASVATESDLTVTIVEQDAPELPTAVVFRDAFMNAPAKFFTESFRRTTFVSSPNVVYHDLVEWEEPDVVIHELAESRLAVAPLEPSTLDFRAVFGDLMLDDPRAMADQRRSRSLALAGRHEEALRAGDDVLDRVAPTARLMLHRARLHLQLGDTAAAAEAARHATTLDPTDGAAWSLLGQLLVDQPGGLRRSATAHAQAARAEPDQPAYWQWAISAALRAGDLRLAEELRREAVGKHPDHPELANAASWVLLATGRLEEAEHAAEYAASVQPDAISHQWQLASIQMRRGNLDDAERTIARLAQLRPDDPDVQHYREVLRRAREATTDNSVEGHDEGQR